MTSKCAAILILMVEGQILTYYMLFEIKVSAPNMITFSSFVHEDTFRNEFKQGMRHETMEEYYKTIQSVDNYVNFLLNPPTDVFQVATTSFFDEFHLIGLMRIRNFDTLPLNVAFAPLAFQDRPVDNVANKEKIVDLQTRIFNSRRLKRKEKVNDDDNTKDDATSDNTKSENERHDPDEKF